MLKSLLLQYEKDFFNYDFFSCKENLYTRIHDDFVEYGRSGHIYDKIDVINSFKKIQSDKNIIIRNFQIGELCSDVVLVHYISFETNVCVSSLRTSIWKKVDGDWKIYFHQGTKLMTD